MPYFYWAALAVSLVAAAETGHAQSRDTVLPMRTLPEVQVLNCAKWKTITLTSGPRDRGATISFLARSFGHSFFVPISNPTGKRGWLQSLTFEIDGRDKNHHPETPLRIYFFVAGHQTHPSARIYKDSVAYVPGRSGRHELDLSACRIALPPEGIDILIEAVGDDTAFQYIRKSVDYEGKPKLDTMYGARFRASLTDKPPSDPDKPWGRVRSMVPYVAVNVRACADD